MRAQKMALSDAAVLLVLGAALPIAVIDIILGVYHLAFIAVAAAAVGIVAMTTGWFSAPEIATRPELELLDRVPAPPRPATIEVVGSKGVCALGYGPGRTWAINENGHLSSPLCRPGVVALSPALQAMKRGEPGGEVACLCPLGGRQVSFAVA